MPNCFPNWKEEGAPLNAAGIRRPFLSSSPRTGATKIPNSLLPKCFHNEGNYVISLGNVCRWLGEQAEALGVEIYPGFAGAEVLFDENGAVKGVATGDMGRLHDGSEGPNFQLGMELHGKYTFFAEGCRGHLGKQLMAQFNSERRRRSANLRHRPQGTLGNPAGKPPARPRRP